MTDYPHRDRVPTTPVRNVPTSPLDAPPVHMYEVVLSCDCGDSVSTRDDLSLGELVDMLVTPETRGWPGDCICAVASPSKPYALTLLA